MANPFNDQEKKGPFGVKSQAAQLRDAMGNTSLSSYLGGGGGMADARQFALDSGYKVGEMPHFSGMEGFSFPMKPSLPGGREVPVHTPLSWFDNPQRNQQQELAQLWDADAQQMRGAADYMFGGLQGITGDFAQGLDEKTDQLQGTGDDALERMMQAALDLRKQGQQKAPLKGMRNAAHEADQGFDRAEQDVASMRQQAGEANQGLDEAAAYAREAEAGFQEAVKNSGVALEQASLSLASGMAHKYQQSIEQARQQAMVGGRGLNGDQLDNLISTTTEAMETERQAAVSQIQVSAINTMANLEQQLAQVRLGTSAALREGASGRLAVGEMFSRAAEQEGQIGMGRIGSEQALQAAELGWQDFIARTTQASATLFQAHAETQAAVNFRAAEWWATGMEQLYGFYQTNPYTVFSGFQGYLDVMGAQASLAPAPGTPAMGAAGGRRIQPSGPGQQAINPTVPQPPPQGTRSGANPMRVGKGGSNTLMKGGGTGRKELVGPPRPEYSAYDRNNRPYPGLPQDNTSEKDGISG